MSAPAAFILVSWPRRSVSSRLKVSDTSTFAAPLFKLRSGRFGPSNGQTRCLRTTLRGLVAGIACDLGNARAGLVRGRRSCAPSIYSLVKSGCSADDRRITCASSATGICGSTSGVYAEKTASTWLTSISLRSADTALVGSVASSLMTSTFLPSRPPCSIDLLMPAKIVGLHHMPLDVVAARPTFGAGQVRG